MVSKEPQQQVRGRALYGNIEARIVDVEVLAVRSDAEARSTDAVSRFVLCRVSRGFGHVPVMCGSRLPALCPPYREESLHAESGRCLSFDCWLGHMAISQHLDMSRQHKSKRMTWRQIYDCMLDSLGQSEPTQNILVEKCLTQ